MVELLISRSPAIEAHFNASLALHPHPFDATALPLLAYANLSLFFLSLSLFFSFFSLHSRKSEQKKKEIERENQETEKATWQSDLHGSQIHSSLAKIKHKEMQ